MKGCRHPFSTGHHCLLLFESLMSIIETRNTVAKHFAGVPLEVCPLGIFRTHHSAWKGSEIKQHKNNLAKHCTAASAECPLTVPLFMETQKNINMNRFNQLNRLNEQMWKMKWSWVRWSNVLGSGEFIDQKSSVLTTDYFDIVKIIKKCMGKIMF